MKLINVIVHLGRLQLDAVVENSKGSRRKIRYTWKLQKEPSDVPPDTWLSSVLGEVDYQMSLEHNPFLGIPK